LSFIQNSGNTGKGNGQKATGKRPTGDTATKDNQRHITDSGKVGIISNIHQVIPFSFRCCTLKGIRRDVPRRVSLLQIFIEN